MQQEHGHRTQPLLRVSFTHCDFMWHADTQTHSTQSSTLKTHQCRFRFLERAKHANHSAGRVYAQSNLLLDREGKSPAGFGGGRRMGATLDRSLGSYHAQVHNTELRVLVYEMRCILVVG